MALDQLPHQREVVTGVLVLAEQRTDHVARGVIDGNQKHQLWSILSEPPMVAAIDLYQHPLPRHALSTNTMLRRTTATRAEKIGSNQYASQRVTGYVYTLMFSQQFVRCVWLTPESVVRARRNTSALVESGVVLGPSDPDGRERVRMLPVLCKPQECAWCGVRSLPSAWPPGPTPCAPIVGC